MRTTVRLPDDLYQRVRVMAAQENETVTSFLEEALRAALTRREQPPTHEPYRVTPFRGDGTQPGVDLDNNAAVADLMDADARG